MPVKTYYKNTAHKNEASATKDTNADQKLGWTLSCNKIIQTRRTKETDMTFHWLRCRNTLGNFRYHWIPGKQNLADYWKNQHQSYRYRKYIYEVFRPTYQIELLLTAKSRIEKRGQSQNSFPRRGCDGLGRVGIVRYLRSRELREWHLIYLIHDISIV